VGLVVGFLIVGLVVAVAAAVVVREAGRLRADPPPAMFDVDDAFDWVVQHVPDIVAATLTPDDVRRILGFQLEYFQRKGVSVNGSTPHPRAPVVVGGAETIDYILERSAATGEAYLPEQVHAVVETQLTYLRAIGAVGAPAGPGDPPPESPPSEFPPEHA
jgi:hypothetical protein